MEFPDNAITNVHRIEGISEISWSQYTLPTVTDPSLGNGENFESPISRCTSEDEDEGIERLQSAEDQLRLAGQHVVLDKVEPALWLFILAEANDTATSDRVRRNLGSQMVGEFDLIELSSGLLEPSELRSSSRVDISTSKPVVVSNRIPQILAEGNSRDYKTLRDPPALGRGALSSPLDLPLSSDHQASKSSAAISLIYPKFLEAVLGSLLFQMTQTGLWTPLGSRSFLGPKPCADYDARLGECGIYEAVSGIPLYSLHIELLPSGSLMITASPNIRCQICRVSDALETGAMSPGVAMGRDVTIAPSGDIHSFIGEVNLQASVKVPTLLTEHEEVSQELVSEILHGADRRASVIRHLMQNGMKVPQGEKWICLRAKEYTSPAGYNSSVPLRFKSRPEFALWPASLCFVDSDEVNVRDVDIITLCKLSEETSLDPLISAEAWFKAGTARQELINAALTTKEKERELKARIAEEASNPDEQDPRSESDSRVNQYLSTQDANRIYPTPPDGLRSEPPGPSDTHEQQVAHVEFNENNRLHSGSDGVDPSETRLPSSPGFGVSSTRYDQATDDDLFGDLDTGLFANSGLTDADFSFFDKPSDDDGKIRDDQLDNERVKPKTKMDEDNASMAAESGFDSPPRAASKPLPNEPDQSSESPGIGSTSHRDQRGSAVSEEAQQSNSLIRAPDQSTSEHERRHSAWPLVQRLDTTRESLRSIDDYVLEHNAEHGRYKRSTFESVLFQDNLENFDSKYVDRGRFGFEVQDLHSISEFRHESTMDEIALPLLHLHQSEIKPGSLRNNEKTLIRLPERRLDTYLKRSSSESDETDEEESLVVSSVFEESSSSEDIEAINEPDPSNSRKRKRERSVDSSQPKTPSFSTPLLGSHSNNCDRARSTSNSVLDLVSPIYTTRTTGQLLANPPGSKVDLLIYAGNDKSFIQIAQVLADQIILESSSLFKPFSTRMTVSQPLKASATTGFDDPLANTLPCVFTKQEDCRLKDYAALKFVGPDNQSQNSSALRKGATRPTMTQSTRGLSMSYKNVFKLEAPYTCVRRAGTLVEASSSVLNFWEELGLGPAYDKRDIIAFCVFPAQGYINDAADTFLSMMGNAYQSCNLGAHIQGSLPENHKGLVPVPITGREVYNILDDIGRTCERLGRCLSQIPTTAESTVIYLVNPFQDRKVLPYLCSAFLTILNCSRKSLQPHPVSNLVLRIIPLDLIASLEAVTLPPARAYGRLALEVYDRCGPNTSKGKNQGSQFYCTPATRLARTLPKTINFKLTPEPSSELLHSDRCFHLSYSWSWGQDWLTACWTDSQGALQWNAAYCLGKEQFEPGQMFSAIAREIWENTLEILRPGNSQWQILIVKDTSMHKDELRAWLSLRSDKRHPSVSIALFTVDPDPPLHFPRPHILNKNLTDPNYPCTTPVSTPYTSILSPDQSGIVSTPGGGAAQANAPTPTSSTLDHNAEARLIDITDETWGVTMAGGLDDPNIPTEFCQALVSGHLIKRAGARDEDGLLVLGVSIIHAQKPDKVLLKEVLSMYRGLGMLARVRGIVDPVSNMLPWHVAAARKAHKAVSSTMRWTGE